MGARRNRKPWVLGALAATVGALWIAACDLNSQPLPPQYGSENSSGPNNPASSDDGSTAKASGSSGMGPATSSSGGGSGQTIESRDAAVSDAIPPPSEADASADAAPESGLACPSCSGNDSGDAAPADGSLDAP